MIEGGEKYSVNAVQGLNKQPHVNATLNRI